MNFLRTN